MDKEVTIRIQDEAGKTWTFTRVGTGVKIELPLGWKTHPIPLTTLKEAVEKLGE